MTDRFVLFVLWAALKLNLGGEILLRDAIVVNLELLGYVTVIHLRVIVG